MRPFGRHEEVRKSDGCMDIVDGGVWYLGLEVENCYIEFDILHVKESVQTSNR